MLALLVLNTLLLLLLIPSTASQDRCLHLHPGNATIPLGGPDTLVAIRTLLLRRDLGFKNGIKVSFQDERGVERAKLAVVAKSLIMPYTVRLYSDGVQEYTEKTEFGNGITNLQPIFEMYLREEVIDLYIYTEDGESSFITSIPTSITRISSRFSVEPAGQLLLVESVTLCDRSTRLQILHEGVPAAGGIIEELLGTMVNLTCHVFGPPPLNITWKHNGGSIGGEPDLSFELTPSSEGWYGCTAIREFTSATAYVHVTGYIPVVTVIPPPRYPIIPTGQSVILTCHVIQWPLQQAQITWSQVGEQTDGSALVVKSSWTTNTEYSAAGVNQIRELQLVLKDMRESQVFQCGKEIASVTVEVLIKEPLLRIRHQGDHVMFTCGVQGSQPLRLDLVLWDSNGERIRAVAEETASVDDYIDSVWRVNGPLHRVTFSCTVKQKLFNRTVISTETTGEAFIFPPTDWTKSTQSTSETKGMPDELPRSVPILISPDFGRRLEEGTTVIVSCQVTGNPYYMGMTVNNNSVNWIPLSPHLISYTFLLQTLSEVVCEAWYSMRNGMQLSAVSESAVFYPNQVDLTWLVVGPVSALAIVLVVAICIFWFRKRQYH